MRRNFNGWFMDLKMYGQACMLLAATVHITQVELDYNGTDTLIVCVHSTVGIERL